MCDCVCVCVQVYLISLSLIPSCIVVYASTLCVIDFDICENQCSSLSMKRCISIEIRIFSLEGTFLLPGIYAHSFSYIVAVILTLAHLQHSQSTVSSPINQVLHLTTTSTQHSPFHTSTSHPSFRHASNNRPSSLPQPVTGK